MGRAALLDTMPCSIFTSLVALRTDTAFTSVPPQLALAFNSLRCTALPVRVCRSPYQMRSPSRCAKTFNTRYNPRHGCVILRNHCNSTSPRKTRAPQRQRHMRISEVVACSCDRNNRHERARVCRKRPLVKKYRTRENRARSLSFLLEKTLDTLSQHVVLSLVIPLTCSILHVRLSLSARGL